FTAGLLPRRARSTWLGWLAGSMRRVTRGNNDWKWLAWRAKHGRRQSLRATKRRRAAFRSARDDERSRSRGSRGGRRDRLLPLQDRRVLGRQLAQALDEQRDLVRQVLERLGPLGHAHDLVERGPLRGREARLAHQRLQLGDRGLVHVPGGQVHVLLVERAAEVVGAEVERDLAGLLALAEPRRLDVVDVVEVEPRGREHA